MMNGETVPQAGNPCRSCTCKNGVVTCKDPVCDCSAPGSRTDKCCPQCDPAASCRHQDLHYLIFRSGERWIYQCQTCECLVTAPASKTFPLNFTFISNISFPEFTRVINFTRLFPRTLYFISLQILLMDSLYLFILPSDDRSSVANKRF